MILILTKLKHPDNTIDCDITVAAEGIHPVGKLTFPNQITWTRFLGCLQRGAVGMRELEVRLDVKERPTETEPTEPEEKTA